MRNPRKTTRRKPRARKSPRNPRRRAGKIRIAKWEVNADAADPAGCRACAKLTMQMLLHVMAHHGTITTQGVSARTRKRKTKTKR